MFFLAWVNAAGCCELPDGRRSIHSNAGTAALLFLSLDTKASHGMSLPLSSTERKETPKLIAHMTQRDIRSPPPFLHTRCKDEDTAQKWRQGMRREKRDPTNGSRLSKPLKSNSLSRRMDPPVNILQTISREGEREKRFKGFSTAEESFSFY